MNAKEFIKKRPHLIWYVDNFEELSDEVIVEAVLNYGEFDDVLGVIEVMGKEKVADIFKKESSKTRSNYKKDIKNYFNLFFNTHA